MQHIKENAAQAPYLPNKRTGPGKAFDKMYSEMKKRQNQEIVMTSDFYFMLEYIAEQTG